MTVAMVTCGGLASDERCKCSLFITTIYVRVCVRVSVCVSVRECVCERVCGE